MPVFNEAVTSVMSICFGHISAQGLLAMEVAFGAMQIWAFKFQFHMRLESIMVGMADSDQKLWQRAIKHGILKPQKAWPKSSGSQHHGIPGLSSLLCSHMHFFPKSTIWRCRLVSDWKMMLRTWQHNFSPSHFIWSNDRSLIRINRDLLMWLKNSSL